ncbi:restriction modification system DNA specificity domain protein [Beutenbergia cavernae DSM 12333]|uniref:Restriction modification system DNA specificity domain protein n=1 Tax=Beutenbergia cavernae (strain ATCC BAA-8 / DSM 12333 / CCUG 43141 / JCM 11478 / NBRC 16432 / NCIMB 13614 / HKI 0122) TaxID=471853 RepID=C5C353_BEUC1|nr:restriction endonuclease subunit S [Beutenbergia cavernae]ACQ79752.1 restriction modification system DNA specificity domain protein [Beutenbergia cavernae DSM 12333]
MTRMATIAATAPRGGFHDGDWVESKDQDPDGDIRLLQLADVGDGKFKDKSDRWINEETFRRLRCSWVHPGDILIARMPDPLGRACVVPEGLGKTITVVDVAVLRPDPDQADAGYLTYAINSAKTRSEVERQQDGATRQRIPRKRLGRVSIPLPPLEEQRRIADFLDAETTQIDALIAEQERLIGLLKERRASGILQAVTRGLRDVDLKPSTLTWVDAVPLHWTVANIRRFAAMKTGHTPSRSNPEYWVDTHIPWFTLADVWQVRDGRRTHLGETENTISDLGLANSAAELLPAGTVVLSRTASVGFSGVMPRPMATSQDFWNWVCGPELVPEYLMYLFRAMRGEFNALMIGSTHKTIYQPVAAAIRVPVPPLEEQHEIVARIDERTRKTDALINEAEHNIALSKERRAALITAAVTGQIDVTTGGSA